MNKDICTLHEELINKKVTSDERKETHKEGEDLWFDLLENLYK